MFRSTKNTEDGADKTLRNRQGRAAAAAAAIVLALPATVRADVHHWAGEFSGNWNIATNWNIGQVPGEGDAVIINAGPLGVLLMEDTALIDTLYVSSGMFLTNNGSRIRVSGSTARTRIVSEGTVLQLMPEGVGGNGKSIDTDLLYLESGAELEMSGGRAEIDEEFRIIGSGSITGHGRIDVGTAADAAFGAVSGDLSVSGGTLRIVMTGGGSMSLPADINVLGPGNRLRLDGDLFAPVHDLDIGNGGRFTVNSNWELGDSIGAIGGTSTIDGTGLATLSGHVSCSTGSGVVFNADAHFPADGSIGIGLASFTMNGDWSTESGHQTSIGWGGRAVLNGDADGFIPYWHGDIDVNGGRLEVNTGCWLNGHTTLNTSFGGSPRIEGSAVIWHTGTMAVTADEAFFDADFQSRPGSWINVANGSILHIRGDSALAGGTWLGSGYYTIAETGSMVADDGESVASDLFNYGRVSPGRPTGLLELDETYTQSATGTLAIDIAGGGLSDADRLEVAGHAQIAGTLEVTLLDGFVPAAGSSFVVLSANSMSGTFDQVTGPEGMNVEYFPGLVMVTFEEPDTCPSDITGDGETGFEDLLSVLAAWGSDDEDADVDGSGEVDFGDLLMVLAAWGSCP